MTDAYPLAFGDLALYGAALAVAAGASTADVWQAEPWDPARQAETADDQADALDEVLFGAIRDHRDCPSSPELAASWALGWLTRQLADNWPDVAEMLISRADGGRP